MSTKLARTGLARWGAILLVWLSMMAMALGLVHAATGEPYLVKEINPTGDSDPWDFVAARGPVLFTADDGTHGKELWKSDGTEAGTAMIKDISPGITNSWALGYHAVAGKLVFFMAQDDVHGNELWRSDGTTAGTTMVKDINPGASDSGPREMAGLNGVLLFGADDGIHGKEFWRSDGTEVGTILVKDIYTGSAGSSPDTIVAANDAVFFRAQDGLHGLELWKSDGTAEGTVLVKDIYTGSSDAWPSLLTNADGTLFFTADDGIHGRELWKSDGTTEGTVMVADIDDTSGTLIQNLAAWDGTLFFYADDGVHGSELWKSDGTPGGTVMVKDINPSGHSSPYAFVPVDGVLFFSADDGVHGYELWKTDGTEIGTEMVKDINPTGSSYPSYSTVVAGDVYFSADDGVHGYELWYSDGTVTGTAMITDVNPIGDFDPSGLYNFAGTLFFQGDDSTHGWELWALEVSSCKSARGVKVSRAPDGALYTGNLIRFLAEAEGTIPFTYTWTLNGAPTGTNWNLYERTFDVPGTYTVGVTVTNDCGQGRGALVVQVEEAGPVQPDLSISDKAASLATVSDGDLVTYTIILRNKSLVSSTVTVTDPIPAPVEYVVGSGQASDGGAVSVVGGELQWSGSVISGTPVLIDFAVRVDGAGLTIGSQITNAAQVADGLGNTIILATASTYNPGYGLIINDGAWFTSDPYVDLAYSWDLEGNIVEVRFSNGPSFKAGPGTSAWLSVDVGNPVYPGWELDVTWSRFLPCVVYAQFRDGQGTVYGPYRDEIYYDNRPPGPPGVDIILLLARRSTAGPSAIRGTDVLLRITATDDNSGVATVQISHDATFAEHASFPFIGPTTDVPWRLQSSGLVYVRTVDRAGNLSPVESEQGPRHYEVYLPLVRR